jgi:multisubunit Na+/H+ antiporter MnhE subunit
MSELIAAAIAAAIGVISGLVILRIIPACFEPRLRELAHIYRLPVMIAQDSWLLLKCLLREMLRRPLRSSFAITQFGTRQDRCRAAAQRALAILFISTTPNSIVLDIDHEENRLFFHQAEPAAVPEIVRQLER